MNLIVGLVIVALIYAFIIRFVAKKKECSTCGNIDCTCKFSGPKCDCGCDQGH